MSENQRISQLSIATSMADADELEIIQGGTNKRLSYTNLKGSLTSGNAGTAATNVTASEFSNGRHYQTVLTLSAVALTPTIPANAEGAGGLIYTFPSGVYIAHSCRMDINSAVVDSATNAADMGVGSVIASGDVSVLSGTSGFEDWVTGQTVADVSSISTDATTNMTAGSPLVFEAGDSHNLYINIAATWNSTVATLSVTGTITVNWEYMGS